MAQLTPDYLAFLLLLVTTAAGLGILIGFKCGFTRGRRSGWAAAMDQLNRVIHPEASR